MRISEMLERKGITKYRVAKSSGIPQTTVIDIFSGKVRLERCSGETLYKLAKALDVSMEALVEDAIDFPNQDKRQKNTEHRNEFEIYKSNICHMVKDIGDLSFIAQTLETDKIGKLWEKKWYTESLYLLAMIDYLCRENDLPICIEYAHMRGARLRETLYPAGIMTLCAAFNNDEPKEESLHEAIPEFLRFNIVESEVRNVY